MHSVDVKPRFLVEPCNVGIVAQEGNRKGNGSATLKRKKVENTAPPTKRERGGNTTKKEERGERQHHSKHRTTGGCAFVLLVLGLSYTDIFFKVKYLQTFQNISMIYKSAQTRWTSVWEKDSRLGNKKNEDTENMKTSKERKQSRDANVNK